MGQLSRRRTLQAREVFQARRFAPIAVAAVALLVGLVGAAPALAQQLPVLSVTKAGAGSGTVTSAPAGIDCGADCSEAYQAGTSVTLNPVPAADSLFAGFTGAADCVDGRVQVNVSTTCTAVFVLQADLPTLTVTLDGSGSVTSAPQGIDCGLDCTETYLVVTTVSLTPTPAAGSVFAGFAGDPDCADGLVAMSSSKTCTAVFVPVPLLPILAVTKAGSGSGTVTSSPAGISCGADCAREFSLGSAVTLIATPAAGSQFAGFSGDPDCTDGAVTLTGSKLCTVAFALIPPQNFPLTVQKTGAGSGQVTSVPQGIDCGADCSEPYASGTVVTLVATPDPGSVFVGFGGAADCTDGVLAVAASTTCQAEFGVTLPPPVPPVIKTVSTGIGGQESNGASQESQISADGKTVVFASSATNLSSACTNGLSHVYVRDVATGLTTCVSVDPNGVQGDGPSAAPALSADGALVAFQSTAANLAEGCAAGGVAQIVLKNRTTGVTTCVSVGPSGGPGNAASAAPALSADGALVAFQSAATNLAAACNNALSHVFVRDRTAGVTSCESVSPTGARGNGASAAPALSADGRFVAFQSSASNLVGTCGAGGLQVYVRDRVSATTTCESAAPGGAPGNGPSRAPSLSGDGYVVAFQSTATNLAPPCTNGIDQIFVRNRAAGLTECASVAADGLPGDGPSTDPALSADGVFVAFSTTASNLVGGGAAALAPPGASLGLAQAPAIANQIVRADHLRGIRQVMSESEGALGNGASLRPSMNRDGTVAAFESTATNLRPNDTNQQPDVFRVELTGRTTMTAPVTGTVFQLVPGATTPVTFSWEALPGAVRYFLEFTGPNRQFTNPNGRSFDPVNGFGGLGGRVEVAGTSVTAPLNTSVPPAVFQLRVIGVQESGELGGTFSDAIFLGLVVGTAVVPGQPTMSAPPSNTRVPRGQAVTLGWTVLPGAVQYLLEVSLPGRSFSNPNGTGTDPANAAASVALAANNVTAAIPLEVPPGAYEIRVIGLSETFAVVGRFSNALTLIID
jgi:Tol biopolymer transport system component